MKLTTGMQDNILVKKRKELFDSLRHKWAQVPAGKKRISTKELSKLPDEALLAMWQEIRTSAVAGAAFEIRGWYHLMYKDILCNKKVMDVGSGLGIDGITFAEHGVQVTFVDIAESNLNVVRRICRMLNLQNVSFCYMEDIHSLTVLPCDYDAIWCQGSLINVPFDIIREEAQELLRHLPRGGRWIELGYPKARWEREGRMPFEKWGEKTDGGAPWIEWYDLEKILARFHPAEFKVLLNFNFYNDDFVWFDLLRVK